MAHRRYVTLESSGSSESDFSSSASSPSPTPPVEKSALSTEPIAGGKFIVLYSTRMDFISRFQAKKDVTEDNEEPSHPKHPQDPEETCLNGLQQGRKRKHKSSDNDNDDKTKGSNPPRSQSKDISQDNDSEEPNPSEHTGDPGEACLSGVQQVVITAIRATDLAFGLRRIPAGFHVVVKTDVAEYQTSNKPVHVDEAVIEWNERILLPCESSSIVRVSVYASFELDLMLSHGELLRTFDISVRELLDRSEKSHPIIFQPKQQEVVSPCTSLFVTVEQRLSNENDSAVICPLATLMSSEMNALLLRTDAGHGLLARYRRTQNNGDLEQSINHFERASDLCPMDNPYRPAALFNLATAKFVSCQADGSYLDLDIPISLFQDALDLRPTGCPDRTVTQLHLAIALLSRFAKRGFQTDADVAEQLLNEVLDIYHANSHIHRAALLAIETSALHPAGSTDANDPGQERPAASMLPLSPNQLFNLTEQCLQRDDPSALDEVIFLHYDALRYYNTMHPCRGQSLCNLSVMLQTRFECRGNDEDLDQAIALQREALALHPVSHTDRSKSLNNLANQLSTRFEHRGNDEDLDQAIALHREALALSPVGHTDRSSSLTNLAAHLSARFDHRGNDEDLDQAIALQREALALHPVGHTDRSLSLGSLANRLSTRFEHRGNDEDLDQAIALQRETLALRPVGHTARSSSLNNLAVQLSTRFEATRRQRRRRGSAIALQREALALRPVGHTARSSSLNNLAAQLSTALSTEHDEDFDRLLSSKSLNNLALTSPLRFEHRGNDKTWISYRTSHGSVCLHPVGPQSSKSLGSLANRLSTRFRTEATTKTWIAIALQREALALRPVGHTARSSSLNNLAAQLSTRFEHRGNDEDLDQAIVLHREALALHPVGHTDRSKSLNNLANQLSTRFEHRGNDEDLDQAIALHREALALCPVGHTDRSKSLGSLANQLSTRFEHRGNDEDLDQAIALQREALALHPIGHTDRSLSLGSLANQLCTRFKHRGNDEDLDQAIALQREALALHSVGHTNRSKSLSNLAAQLRTRFEHRGNDEDLDQAIALQREALALRPVGHTARSSSLNNLAAQLSIRFEHRGNDEDLDQAIALQREALALHPVGHTDRSKSLNNLAIDLSTRFEHRGNDEDLNQAITFQREALALSPVGHTDRSMSLGSLANQLSTRFAHRGNDEDLDQAIVLQREALVLRPVGHTGRSMSLNNLANRLSTRFDYQHNGEDLNESREILRCALTLLTQHDPRQIRVHKSLAKVYLLFYRSGLDRGEDTDSLDAVMHHLKAAVNVVSGRLLSRLRASLNWVYYADQHAHGTQLEAYATSMQLLDTYMSATATVSSRHSIMKDFPRTLAVDAASCALRSGDVCRAVELLEQGRTLIWTQMARLRTPLDNLQTCGDHAVTLMKRFRDLSFLLEKSHLSHADEETRYRRLVEDWNRAVEEIRKIEGFSRFLLPPLFSNLQDAARNGPYYHASCKQILVDKLQRTGEAALKKALMELWDDVVRPVVENLGGFAQPHSRIWWPGEPLLSHLYISSYTPSLTALMKARKSYDRSLPVPFAAIGQNLPDGASFTLDGVEPELDLVRSLIPPPPTVSFTKITSADATKSRALHALRDNTWLHFACHGTQNHQEPFKSAFLMRDQPLSLFDITQTDLSRHEFVFLSACDTAVGDRSTPDEVIHLAAGLQFAGVQSVVGTLWKVNDSTVERLVKAFYRNMCGDGRMNSKRAARALHRAVQSLASDTGIPLEQRILFIHIGI
ncbi:CHAT domain-containing protein [Suillus lakei]|nr:CHAT domain-containing protein [Suillus lakei]